MALRLPRLKANLPIVDGKGNPRDYFLRFWNIEVAPTIERAETAQDETIQALQEVLESLQANIEATQQAQEAANDAQESADGGGAAKSGSSKNPNVNLPPDNNWVSGPQVDLIGVSAGNLTITGSGPQQDADVSVDTSMNTIISCEFRIVEIEGMTETTVFTGGFLVKQFDPSLSPIVTNNSASSVSSFSLARSNTGDISYRIDARNNGSYDVYSLLLYLFVRRS